mgnify:CR=1 FL=1
MDLYKESYLNNNNLNPILESAKITKILLDKVKKYSSI